MDADVDAIDIDDDNDDDAGMFGIAKVRTMTSSLVKTTFFSSAHAAHCC
uniref:Uncharacterized protein n=1 Tax=Peronospora matthiolae TaxID=2874970 RepID=A0AAV1UWP2_9STRA